MYPKNTVYRMLGDGDQDQLFEWIREKMGILSHIGWPSLIAERDGELLGCIVTQARDDAVVCGPILAENAIIAARLVSIYEDLLVRLGIKEYLFSVKDPATSDVVRAMVRKQIPYVDLGENDGQHWYKRRIA